MANVVAPYEHPEYRRGALIPPNFAAPRVDRRIADVEAVARWFDYAFVLPGGFRFGLAGIAGLIPGLGDVFDALVSLYIVGRAIQLGIPRVAIARMLANVGIEALAGSIPWVGDLFDIVFKANRRNYQLLERYIVHPVQVRRRQTTADWMFVGLLFFLVILSIALPVAALILIAKHL
jgi:hypothetical protein